MTTNPTTPAPSSSTPAAPSTSPPMFEPHPKAALSPTESAQLAQWAKENFAKGKITQAQLEQQFNELNTPQKAGRTTDPKTPEQQQLDVLHPPAKASEYTIRYYRPAKSGRCTTPEVKQFDQSARTWLAGAQFDRMTGNSLVNTIDRVAQQTHKMTPEQLHFYGETEYAKLEKAYGPKLEEKLQRRRPDGGGAREEATRLEESVEVERHRRQCFGGLDADRSSGNLLGSTGQSVRWKPRK